MERETGIEPATNGLEGRGGTHEELSPILADSLAIEEGGHLCQNALPRSNTVSPSLMVSST